MRRLYRLDLIAALLGAALVLTLFWPRAMAPNAPGLTCRPSAPALVAEHTGQPALLIFGNSLLFDHGWRVPGFLPVNCARQGLTAAEALPLMAGFGDLMPEAILLGFGSVEALRAVLTETVVAPDIFGAEMDRLLSEMQARWPEVPIHLASVPIWTKSADTPPALLHQTDAEALNAELAGLANARTHVFLFDLSELPSVDPADWNRGTYDGVHLTPAVYRDWEAALAQRLAR